jgi:hypothetical protein
MAELRPNRHVLLAVPIPGKGLPGYRSKLRTSGTGLVGLLFCALAVSYDRPRRVLDSCIDDARSHDQTYRLGSIGRHPHDRP